MASHARREGNEQHGGNEGVALWAGGGFSLAFCLPLHAHWPVSPSADQMGWGWVASWVWGAVKATRLG